METNPVRPTSSTTPRRYSSDTCAVPGCEEERFARGFCGMHYSRWRRTGDVGEPGVRGQGGHALRGRAQTPEHVAKRIAAMRATLATVARKCDHCGDEFSPASGGQRYCSALCYDTSKRAREAKWETSRRLRIPKTLRAELVAAQDGKCGLCGERRPLAVDHCHATRTIRGMLCGRCNRGIGLLDDDPGLLQRAIDYLVRHDPTTARSIDP